VQKRQGDFVEFLRNRRILDAWRARPFERRLINKEKEVERCRRDVVFFGKNFDGRKFESWMNIKRIGCNEESKINLAKKRSNVDLNMMKSIYVQDEKR